jgi:hypothetical protein
VGLRPRPAVPFQPLEGQSGNVGKGEPMNFGGSLRRVSGRKWRRYFCSPELAPSKRVEQDFRESPLTPIGVWLGGA